MPIDTVFFIRLQSEGPITDIYLFRLPQPSAGILYVLFIYYVNFHIQTSTVWRAPFNPAEFAFENFGSTHIQHGCQKFIFITRDIP